MRFHPLIRRYILFLSFIVLLPTVFALHNQPYHLKLLAVEESDAGFSGSPADLYLEIKEGSGRVFLDTQPLTKLDTQVSTRFAKDIACNHFKLDCKNYDFIYTIKADSSIVGGPSAGAAIAALTTIALLDLPVDNSTTITATVNSGGIVGPVGGIKEKLDAAAQAGMKKVLVAKGITGLPAKGDGETNKGNEEEEANEEKDEAERGTEQGAEQFDLRHYAQDILNLELVEVMDLDEVILQLTGKDLNHQPLEIVEDQAYTKIMSSLADLLCSRTEKIRGELAQRQITLDEQNAEALTRRQGSAQNATQKEDYYSAASFCFGSNIQLKTYYYQREDATPEALRVLVALLVKKVQALEQNVAAEKIETISDLQTLMVVKERLQDVREQIIIAQTAPSEELPALLAYAEERYFSAVSWMQFFSMEGKEFVLDKEHLKQSCQQKISEAEERSQYANLYGGLISEEKEGQAKEALKNGEYELCLITAAQAKADANAVLSVLGVSQEMVKGLLESKSRAVERVIAENSVIGIFPILGFSYYQYANSLQLAEPYTTLVYYEYALEMSDLGIYFPEKERPATSSAWLIRKEIVTGGIIAALLTALVFWWRQQKLGQFLPKLGKGRRNRH
ncbi:MAG: S16 family serine protease [Nanoarchaeota archaeon]